VSRSLSLRSASRVAAEGTSVQISIVTATLLCRRICIATRGCTSRAAGSEPHVLRVPRHVRSIGGLCIWPGRAP